MGLFLFLRRLYDYFIFIIINITISMASTSIATNTLTFNQFLDKFIVKIKNITTPLVYQQEDTANTDFTYNYIGSVGFLVICKLNGYIHYFEYPFNQEDYTITGSPNKMIDFAWNKLKDRIKTWASDIITNNKTIINYNYIPTIPFNQLYSNLDLSIYNLHYTTKITLFEIAPPETPNGWDIGFTIINNVTKETTYKDARVDMNSVNIIAFDHDVPEISILDNAWNQIKDEVGSWASIHLTFLDNVYIPSSF